MNGMGIKARLLLMTLLPTGLMALILASYFTWQQLREVDQQLLQRGLMTVEHLQRPAADALLNGDTQRFALILTAALNHTDLRSLTLFDADMQPLEHRGPVMYPAGSPLTGTELTAGTGLQIQRGASSRFLLPLLASAELPNRNARPDIDTDSLLGWLEVELSHGRPSWAGASPIR